MHDVVTLTTTRLHPTHAEEMKPAMRTAPMVGTRTVVTILAGLRWSKEARSA